LGETVSFRETLGQSGISEDALGLLLEWQLGSLDGALHKEEVRSVMQCLCRDTLQVYNIQYPIRRARFAAFRFHNYLQYVTTDF
jgi:hypothetical protein